MCYTGSTSARPPHFTNLALATPDDFKVSNRDVVRVATGSGTATFFLIGRITENATEQICVQPAAQTMERMVALLGLWYGKDKLFFNQWKDGISIRKGYNDNECE